MIEHDFADSPRTLTGGAGRREAVRSLGAAVLGVLAALGLTGAAAKPKRTDKGGKGGGKGRHPKNQRKHRPAGEDKPPAATGAVEPEGLGLLRKAGPTGPTGPTGPAGARGESGPQGPQGAGGDAGPAGPSGTTGPTGATGPSSPEPTITVVIGGVFGVNPGSIGSGSATCPAGTFAISAAYEQNSNECFATTIQRFSSRQYDFVVRCPSNSIGAIVTPTVVCMRFG